MPLSSVFRQKLAELTEEGLKGEALIKRLDKEMDSDISLKLAMEKEMPKGESGEYTK